MNASRLVCPNPFDPALSIPLFRYCHRTLLTHDHDDDPLTSRIDRHGRRDTHDHRFPAPGDQDLAKQIGQGRVIGNVRVFMHGRRTMDHLRLYAGRVPGNPGEWRDALHRGDHSCIQDSIWLMPVFYLARPFTAEMSLPLFTPLFVSHGNV